MIGLQIHRLAIFIWAPHPFGEDALIIYAKKRAARAIKRQLHVQPAYELTIYLTVVMITTI